MTDFEKALQCPDCVFLKPINVLEDDSLTYEQKKAILEQWKVDAHEIQVADEENMHGDSESMLSRVMRALAKLEAEK